jgi:diguanylate cyclase (GGDEF)-like protein
MTLSKQLMLVILILFALVFAGSFIITVQNSRTYFAEQLESNARDTAASLGLSLSPYMKDKDMATMLSMVKAIFENGYFSKIEITNMQGKTLIERRLELEYANIPAWFVKLVHLPKTKKSAIIMSGWHQAGYINVVSNPGYAYTDLWQNMKSLFYWNFLLMMVILLGGAVAIKIIFRPLEKVAAQAEAICSKKFHIEEKLPKTFELRKVTVAMNNMVSKLKAIFNEQAYLTEKLREQAFQDSLTGIGNRRFFMQKISHLLSSEDDYSPGFLIMAEVEGLEKFNHQHGYQKGDELIQDINHSTQTTLAGNATAFQARLGGTTFAAIVFDTDKKVINTLCERLIAAIRDSLLRFDKSLSLSIGAFAYQQSMKPATVLALCDEAVFKASGKGQYAYHITQDEKTDNALNATEWGNTIKAAIKESRFIFYQQQVVKGKDVFHRELFIRMLDENGRIIAAGSFLPFAEKFGLSFDIDKFVISNINSKLSTIDRTIAINLSSQTFSKEIFVNEYLDMLQAIPYSERYLIHLELSEMTAFAHFDEVKDFVTRVHLMGYVIGIDRVGANFSPLYYLIDLNFDYLKLDGSLIHDIDENTSKQFFIQNLKHAAKTLDIEVIATNVETKEQWQALESLSMYYAQGVYFAPIEKLQE